jgi:hypothetical protein
MSKQTETERVHCNICRGPTFHRVVGKAQDSGREDDTGFSWTTMFTTLQCCGCREVVLRRIFRFSENQEDEVRYFPPKMSRYQPRWRYNLPRNIRVVLEEIYRSLDGENVLLPMMGTRTLLDMLMLDKIKDVGTFAQKLDAMEQAGLIGKVNRKVLEAALDAGSATAHRGHTPEEHEVHSVLDIVENALQAAYVFPRIERQLRESTPRRKL